MNSDSCHNGTSQPVPNESFSFKLLDDTVNILQRQAQQENRDLTSEEQIFLEAESYARRFASKLWQRNVHVSFTDREDFRSDYYVGALAAIRNGTTEMAEIEKAGRREVNRFRDRERRWREAAVFIDDPEVEKRLFPHAGTEKDVDHERLSSAYDRMTADPMSEMKEALQSGVLESCVDQLPETRRLIIHSLLYGDCKPDRFDNKPATAQVAERLGLSVREVWKHIEIAEEELRPLVRAAILNAPSHPDAVLEGKRLKVES